MGKQHQLLAVEQDTKNQYTKTLIEAAKLFKNSTKFVQLAKTYTAFNEGDRDIPGAEVKEMTTTVKEKLKYLKPFMVKYVDTLTSKETTNQVAKSKIIVKDEDGNELFKLDKEIPVSALLQLEKIFTEIRGVYNSIPTFDTEKMWVKGTNNKGEEAWVVKDTLHTVRSKKEAAFDTINVGEKFPKKVVEKIKNVPIGEYLTTEATGTLSPKEKADIMGRLDKVIVGLKIARAQANETEVTEQKIAMKLLNFINEG